MRLWMAAIASVFGVSTACYARQHAPSSQAPAQLATVFLPRAASLPPREAPALERPVSYREYRIDPSFHADRSAHSRAIDEMNAINMRRPRVFRFRPVMALTFDAADIDGPARMSGIAPNLMGFRKR